MLNNSRKRVDTSIRKSHRPEHIEETIHRQDEMAEETADPYSAFRDIGNAPLEVISPSNIFALQQTVGNRAVQRLLVDREQRQSSASEQVKAPYQRRHYSVNGDAIQRVTDIKDKDEKGWYAETKGGQEVRLDPNSQKGPGVKNCHGYTYGTSDKWGYSPEQSVGVGRILQDEAGSLLFEAKMSWIKKNLKKQVPSKGQLVVFLVSGMPGHSAKVVNSAKKWSNVEVASVQGYGGALDANKNITEEPQWSNDNNTVRVYSAVPQPTGDETDKGKEYRS